MGFLDHSTNNIILDAVLTDKGREFLARNDGSFSIHKFALGDDEVNYTIVTKYGRTVGKEKIEKNTPVFEALTNQGYAQKFKLVSVSNPNLLRMPRISLSGDSSVNASINTVTLSTAGGSNPRSATIRFEQTMSSEETIPVELRDQLFIIEVPNMFCQISGQVPENIDSYQRATYLITRSPDENASRGSKLEFKLELKSLTSAIFQTYGVNSNKTTIKAYIKVTGVQSGATSEFTLLINK